MPNGRSRGRRRGRRPKRRSNEKGGRTVQTAAPALFAFMGSLSSSVGLSAWRWACAVPRCGSRCFRNGQRKAIIRTHRLSETGSDYIGLVPVVGLEPTRCRQRRILNPLRLPIPSHRQICRNPLRRELWRELGKLLNEVYLESLEKSRGRQNDGLLDVLAFESVTSTNSITPAKDTQVLYTKNIRMARAHLKQYG